MSDFNPTQNDIEWVSGLIQLIKDGGQWGLTCGLFYTLDKTNKILKLTKLPNSDIAREMNERNRIVFERLNWKFLDCRPAINN